LPESEAQSPANPAYRCVVCGAFETTIVLSVDRAPIHAVRPAGATNGFGRLTIVACSGCGHLSNAAFDARQAEELYSALVLTNEPVSPGMIAAVDETAALIMRHLEPGSAVLEIGGGGGALSLALARRSARVDLIEPCRSLRPERFIGTGVNLHRAMFPTLAISGRRFAAVVCRQVIEHIPEPAGFLATVRASLADDGIAYIELPSADDILRRASIVDFHYPHVHYYRRSEMEVLLAGAGFEIIDVVDIKDGHDVGFLLRTQVPWQSARPNPSDTSPRALSSALAERRAQGLRRLATIDGPIALYGANAYAQALLGLSQETVRFAVMFDDTATYAGRSVYGPACDITIEPPSGERLADITAVVIAAYLHDAEIARKVSTLGFRGPIYTLRAPAPERPSGITSLFDS
jgi:2-polyprenyl-3-methyl-5-hydroxy-6-metoxy-1,4-benzoquinol methylase